MGALVTEDEKRLTDRARVIQSYIDEERARIVALVEALHRDDVDNYDFLLYCIANSYTAAELVRAMSCFASDKPVVDDIEDLM